MPPSRPPQPRSFRRWLRSNALALWLWSLGLLGVIRFFTRAMRDSGADTVAWLYLVGGVLVFVAGVMAWAGAVRRDRTTRPD
ncbi:hypothetical protein [Marilutibacter chinensis]|uniref:Uncharacterized protein n=1 Tax=Marilutibacter chinensis TaxID=2912247 RepID=A0ABS9HW52_9GAMM|nr:hypothetical protein [Lysobacter chinensis]MCF7222380.1 hypothetical protein [Lysobacter chinensis]